VETPETDPSPSGSVPSPAASGALSRKQLEEEKRKARGAFLAEMRAAAAKRKAAQGETSETAPDKSAAPASVPDPKRTDTDRKRDLAVFLSVVWRILQGAAWLVGYKLDPLTEREAAEDAPAWLPITLRYPAFDRAVTWVAAPFRLMERIASKIHTREKTPAPPKLTAEKDKPARPTEAA
jgi:hypothetical protein